ncbi:tetratricopeptide repeat protein [candidate division KSB1 bacterium]|nr:tetratricopeptide repeat protein [candidate division KSB1 bacterium]
MSNQAIKQISDTVKSIIARPFTHEELLRALEEIAQKDPTSPAPPLAMAIAFGLGHRDLDALKGYLDDTEKLLSTKLPIPRYAEFSFLKALYAVLHYEALLVEQRRTRRLGVAMKAAEQRLWNKKIAASKSALDKMKNLAKKLSGNALISMITPAMQAMALSSEADSKQFSEAVDALFHQFWQKEEMGELAGFFLMFSNLKCQNLADATKIGEEMVQRNPNNLLARTTLGSVYYFNNKHDAALKSFSDAVLLAPSNAHVRLGYAKIAWKLGKYGEASNTLTEAKRLDRDQKLTLHLSKLSQHIQLSRKFNIKPFVRPHS